MIFIRGERRIRTVKWGKKESYGNDDSMFVMGLAGFVIKFAVILVFGNVIRTKIGTP